MKQNDGIHEMFIKCAEHLTELLDGGASVYVLKLTDSVKPMEFDLSKRDDLIAISRFLIRHLIVAAKDYKEERDGAEMELANMEASIESEYAVPDHIPGYLLDRDKDRGGAHCDDSPLNDPFLPPPHGLYDND